WSSRCVCWRTPNGWTSRPCVTGHDIYWTGWYPMSDAKAALEPGWMNVLAAEFDTDYMVRLRAVLREEKQEGETVFPPGADIFRAFDDTPEEAVKVVILGQDPYHGPGQAHGLCFPVQPGVRVPPSLVNIFKEIDRDLGIP